LETLTGATGGVLTSAHLNGSLSAFAVYPSMLQNLNETACRPGSMDSIVMAVFVPFQDFI